MVDTLVLYFRFPSLEAYNRCFQAVDVLSRQAGQAIHKDSKGSDKAKRYVTTAFAKIGILQIAFNDTHYYACYLQLQPIRLFYPNSHMRLSKMEDYPAIISRMNEFLTGINQVAEEAILPSIDYWHVVRIDYAYDAKTPFVSEYLRLFRAGDIPNGFGEPEEYITSAYFKSANCFINIYDKVSQVRQKFGLTDEDIVAEIGRLPEGILRMEIQCHADYVQYLKNFGIIPDTTLPYLFDPVLAEMVLHKRVASLVGTTDFYPYAFCEKRIYAKYNHRTASACCSILRDLMNVNGLNLRGLRRIYEEKRKRGGSYFNGLLFKIRQVGMNPIPLDLAYGNEQTCKTLPFLKNPNDFISFKE